MLSIGMHVEEWYARRGVGGFRAELCGSHTVPLQGFDEQLPTLLDCMHELLLPYEDTTLVTWGSRPLSLLVAAMARVGCLLPEPITHSVDWPTR